MSDQIFWYITRSAALVTWVTSAGALLSGLLTSSRLLGRRPSIPWLVDIHRYLAAMSMMFLGIHMASLWFDAFVAFHWADLFVPWAATVPGLSRTSIALGVLAGWLLAIVQVTSYVKDRLPEDVWRTIHLGSFGTLVLGTIHAIQAGTDASNPIVVGLGVSMLTAIALATAGRVVRLRQQADQPMISVITTTGRHRIVPPDRDSDRGAAPERKAVARPPRPLPPPLR